jgi:DNA-binding CsgD family transcriptional regulator
MTAPVPATTATAAHPPAPALELVGRAAERAELVGMVEPPPTASRVVVMLGPAGIGKTVLVDEVVRHATLGGLRVLRTAGRESEASLAFAALQSLLRSIEPARLDRLPGPQRDALAALGASGGEVAVDRLLIGFAVLSLLTDLAREAPVLLVVEDAHWVDLGSLDVLRIAAHRLAVEPVVVVLTAREDDASGRYLDELPQLRLEPLRPADARRLLDRQPRPAGGALRDQILTHASGNPMALIEFNRAAAADPSLAGLWSGAPLPVDERLAAVITAQVARLPRATQDALLYAAVADGPDSAQAIAASDWGQDAELLAPAEERGLVRVDRSGPHFTHPLVRSAVYYGASFTRRAAVHRRLAEVPGAQPDRRAWHLAAATLGTDDRLAELLEATAADAQRRDGSAAAVVAMRRAAELSEDAEDRARRFTDASLLAVLSGQLDLVVELAELALGLTSDPVLRIRAREAIGFALSLSSHLAESVDVLLSVAAAAAERGMTYEAWDCLRNAAQAAYFAGTPPTRDAVRAALARLEGLDASGLTGRQRDDIVCFRLWARCTTDPFGDRDDLLDLLDGTVRAVWSTHDADDGVRRGVDVASADQVVAASAWVLDEPDRAIGILRHVAERLSRPGLRGTSPSVLALLSLCLVDVGRWDEALETADTTEDVSVSYRIDIATVSSCITKAQVLALRGEVGAARRELARATALFDLDQARIVDARVRRASALADLAERAYGDALAQLDGLFDADGVPLHRYESYPALADLAEAYVHCDRRHEGRVRVASILERLHGDPSPRLRQIFLRAQACLADPGAAEGLFRAALADPRGARWPFERARVNLDLGEWLRRQRRIKEARVFLQAGLETATRLGAEPTVRRAQAELRACGVRVADAPDALAELTSQQREIVRLAADGLTNREIAARLFLSPRTVASHLYRSYPKLGVTDRHELRDALACADDDASPVV